MMNAKKIIVSALFLLLISACGDDPASPVLAPTYKRIFVTAATFNGSAIGGIAGADALCGADTKKPAGAGSYKAMLADGATRVACATANCATNGIAENIGWVFKANTKYVRADGTVIGTTNSNGIFDFPLTNPIETTVENVWTGIGPTWTTAGIICTGWTAAGNGAVGNEGDATASQIFVGAHDCSTNLDPLICVEQ